MPAGTIRIGDGTATDVLDVVDGGWASGGQSLVNANYDTALNLSYLANNAIELGNIDLSGGDLSPAATSPYNISITSTGGLVEANELSFDLVAVGTGVTGGFGTSRGSDPHPDRIAIRYHGGEHGGRVHESGRSDHAREPEHRR